VAIAYVANRDRRYLGRKQLIRASAKGVSKALLAGEDKSRSLLETSTHPIKGENVSRACWRRLFRPRSCPPQAWRGAEEGLRTPPAGSPPCYSACGISGTHAGDHTTLST
jgi:hypothetical protein